MNVQLISEKLPSALKVYLAARLCGTR